MKKKLVLILTMMMLLLISVLAVACKPSDGTVTPTPTNDANAAPVITGVEEGGVYYLGEEIIRPTFDVGVATLKKGDAEEAPFTKGSKITEPGIYQISATNNAKNTTVNFEVKDGNEGLSAANPFGEFGVNGNDLASHVRYINNPANDEDLGGALRYVGDPGWMITGFGAGDVVIFRRVDFKELGVRGMNINAATDGNVTITMKLDDIENDPVAKMELSGTSWEKPAETEMTEFSSPIRGEHTLILEITEGAANVWSLLFEKTVILVENPYKTEGITPGETVFCRDLEIGSSNDQRIVGMDGGKYFTLAADFGQVGVDSFSLLTAHNAAETLDAGVKISVRLNDKDGEEVGVIMYRGDNWDENIHPNPSAKFYKNLTGEQVLCFVSRDRACNLERLYFTEKTTAYDSSINKPTKDRIWAINPYKANTGLPANEYANDRIVLNGGASYSGGVISAGVDDTFAFKKIEFGKIGLDYIRFNIGSNGNVTFEIYLDSMDADNKLGALNFNGENWKPILPTPSWEADGLIIGEHDLIFKVTDGVMNFYSAMFTEADGYPHETMDGYDAFSPDGIHAGLYEDGRAFLKNYTGNSTMHYADNQFLAVGSDLNSYDIIVFYSINFGSGVTLMELIADSDRSGVRLDMYLDGLEESNFVGSFLFDGKNWGEPQNYRLALEQAVSGTHDIVLVCKNEMFNFHKLLAMDVVINAEDLEVDYDGQPKAVSATTDPEGLELTYEYEGAGLTEYDRTTVAPTEPGMYLVIITCESVGSTHRAVKVVNLKIIGQEPLTIDAYSDVGLNYRHHSTGQMELVVNPHAPSSNITQDCVANFGAQGGPEHMIFKDVDFGDRGAISMLINASTNKGDTYRDMKIAVLIDGFEMIYNTETYEYEIIGGENGRKLGDVTFGGTSWEEPGPIHPITFTETVTGIHDVYIVGYAGRCNFYNAVFMQTSE